MARSQVNKAHKSRFASKASRHLHRTSNTDKQQIAKPAHRNAAKAARVQRCKMIRDQKRAALLEEKRSASGLSSAPRVIVLCGLSALANPNMLARDLLLLLSGEETQVASATIASSNYKLRTTVLVAPYGDLLSCMEMAKVADLIAFVLSANSLHDGHDSDGLIDSFGKQVLSVFNAVGLPSTAVMIRDLPTDIRRKQDLKKMSVSSLASKLPEGCRFYTADTKEELHKFMWLFKEQRLSAPDWRNQRPYIMSQEVGYEPDHDNTGMCTLLLSGYVRAHSLSVNQLVFSTILPEPLYQEPLMVENIPDPLAGEQTWPTESELAEADQEKQERKLKKKILPRGTSDYQAAWIVEETDEEDSDGSDEEGDVMVLDAQNEHQVQDEYEESDAEEATHSLVHFDEETNADTEMADDENLSKEQIEAEIKKLKVASAVDKEFPDEVDTPMDIPAKKRFAKYRGLKSFRTSLWDPKESLPPEYARIFAFDDFNRTRKHVLLKVLDRDNGKKNDCVSVGTYVRLHIKHVPADVAFKICSLSGKSPIVACGLLQHESKMSVLHFRIEKHESYDAPIKSKDTFIFNVGFRQFIARPIFSSDYINCTKHKMERFLHPEASKRCSTASVYAPICFPLMPVIVLKSGHDEKPIIAAVGSLQTVDPNRIILKKIILTGYPQKVSKLKASVRFMFHQPDDVRWFKPVALKTKCGRHGRIKEPVGTHGAMKCVFDGPVQQHDTVCMELYKRVFPKWPEQRFPLCG